MIANAAAPLTAHGGLDRGLGFHGVSFSMPFRDVSVGACLGMNRLGKYSFARHRQEARPGSARSCGPGGSNRCADQGREGPQASSFSLARDGVDRALADAEIGDDVLARVSGKHQVQDLALTTVRLATHVAAVPAICIALPRRASDRAPARRRTTFEATCGGSETNDGELDPRVPWQCA